MLFCFYDICVEILGSRICAECHILAQFCQMLLPQKGINNYLLKSYSAFSQNMLVKLSFKLILFYPINLDIDI